jgi:hypothetical protein
MAEKGKKPSKASSKAKPKAKPKPKVSDKSDGLTRVEKIALAHAENVAKNKAKLLNALSKHGGNVTQACKSTRLSRQTHYEYLNDPAYAAAVNDVYEVGCDEAEQTIIELMRTSEMDKVRLDAAKEILKARGKARGYGVEKREQNIKGDLNVTAQPVIVRLPDNGRRTFSDTTKPTDV